MLLDLQRNARSLSDNRPAGARRLGTLNGTKAFRDSVSTTDKVDFYTFNVTGRSSFNLGLTRLQNNVDVFLQKGSTVIARSTKRGKKAESISATLDAGTYLVRVNQKSGSSRYRLSLGAALASNPAAQKLVSLYRPAAAPVPRYGLVDVSTGTVSELPLGNSVGQLTLVDIASSGGKTYAIDLLSTFYQVDATTGNYTRLGDLGGFLSNIAYNSLGFASSGALYTIGTNRTTRQSGLYTVDIVAGGTVTLVANLPGLVDVGDVAFDATSGRFFASASTASTGNSLLYSIGLGGDAQFIGDIGFSGVGALLFDNGILYGYNSVFVGQQTQIRINTTTGVGTVDKLLTKNGQSFGGISGGA